MSKFGTAVLLEAISVIVRRATLEEEYPGRSPRLLIPAGKKRLMLLALTGGLLPAPLARIGIMLGRPTR